MIARREGERDRAPGRLAAGILAVCALVAIAGLPCEAAERLEAGGISLAVAPGWKAAPGDAEGVWVRSRGTANLNIAVIDRYSEVSPGRSRLARAEIERAAGGALGGGGSFQMHEFGVVDIGGVPAYRMECTVEVAGTAVRQLQFVLSGTSTFVVTFSAPAETFDALRGEFERMAMGIRLRDRAGTLEEMPASFCGWVLAVLLAASGAGRWARRRLRRSRGRRLQERPCPVPVLVEQPPVTAERGSSNSSGV